MTVLHQPGELAGRRVCLAIGMFDGVHLGHQQVLRQTVTDAGQRNAMPVAVTFDRHPSLIVAPDHAPPLIYSLPQKLRTISALGMEATLLIQFTKTFSEQPADYFIRSLHQGFGGIASICVGAAFAFGHRRSGNVALLKMLGTELQFAVHGLASVQLDGRKISSTSIRTTIREGFLDAAGQMLGRPYSLSGIIKPGDQLGRTLGAPTANLDVTGLVLPPSGVYAALVHRRNSTHMAALNIGHRPTLGQAAPELRVEVHLLDFNEDLYGEELEVIVLQKIREEQRFPSLDALRARIQDDLQTIRALLSRPPDAATG